MKKRNALLLAAAGLLLIAAGFLLLRTSIFPVDNPVSYTHLDVYKRQGQKSTP